MSHNDVIGKAMTKAKFNFSMNHVIGFSMEYLMKYEEGQCLLRIFENNLNFDFILDNPKYIYFTMDGSLYNYGSVFYGIILP